MPLPTVTVLSPLMRFQVHVHSDSSSANWVEVAVRVSPTTGLVLLSFMPVVSTLTPVSSQSDLKAVQFSSSSRRVCLTRTLYCLPAARPSKTSKPFEVMSF